ncbi:hypothetical protein [Methylovulum psychrotolerans]|uniref:Type I restriction endonuclease subunit M n=1 Tax=Methylovulum psychrotolerans TaxID=1704499 RepID=A0A2S5CG62_9GAMM|nr:hypothetical protein [Methylovulum psychrotolerans]POZ49795.1 hypothetical protein AADEFJLK_04410 [Methylovulum psychrotolerans]
MAQQPFPLGQTLATPGALETLETLGIEPSTLLDRHLSCDWSDMEAEDQKSNREALKNGSRVFSSYRLGDGVKIWVITEADRSCTTILLPSEY